MNSLPAKSASKRADCQCEPQDGCWFWVTMWVSQSVFVSWLCAGSRVSSMTCSFSSVVATFYSSPSSPDWVVPSQPIPPSTPSQWGSHSPAIHPNWVLLPSFKLSFLSRQMGYVLNVVSFKNKLCKKNFWNMLFWLAIFWGQNGGSWFLAQH